MKERFIEKINLYRLCYESWANLVWSFIINNSLRIFFSPFQAIKYIRKAKVFWCFQRVERETSGMKWVNIKSIVIKVEERMVYWERNSHSRYAQHDIFKVSFDTKFKRILGSNYISLFFFLDSVSTRRFFLLWFEILRKVHINSYFGKTVSGMHLLVVLYWS